MKDRGEDTVLLDGTLIDTDRVNDSAPAPVDQPSGSTAPSLMETVKPGG